MLLCTYGGGAVDVVVVVVVVTGGVVAPSPPTAGFATGGGGGCGVGGAVFCSSLYRFSMPLCWRLRISQRRSFDSLMPIRMSLIDSYTDGSEMIFPAVPCPV